MTQKIGILGGGQLGRMFLQSAYDYPFEYHFLDHRGAPCQSLSKNFCGGDFNDEQTILDFATSLDVIGIEIEHVNIDALKILQSQGKTIIPSPDALEKIKDKGLQKAHYESFNICSPDYYLIDGVSEINTARIGFPFVQKLRTGGYDGKGVQVIKKEEELSNVWDEPSVIEVFTPIAKEIAVMIAVGQNGEIRTYPSVEMVFDPQLNLVDYLFSPAQMSERQQQKVTSLAQQVAKSFGCAGLFAVELFIDQMDNVWVNETAPRVHNSCHHTIEASYCSQFEQMLRILTGLPLGNPQLREPAAMINLVGAQNHQGKAKLSGIEHVAAMDKTYLHWYGKDTTSPGRKMGHVTVLGNLQDIREKINSIKSTLSVVTLDELQ